MKYSSKGKGVEIKVEAQYIETFAKEVITIEKSDADKTPEAVAEVYLLYSHDLPSELPKTREFFERILEETGSILFEFYEKLEIDIILLFQRYKILNILKPQDWGYDLRKQRNFKDQRMFPKSFIYFDYMIAWEIFLLINYIKMLNIPIVGSWPLNSQRI